MNKRDETMRQAADILSSWDVPATWEYPGFISIRVRGAYGNFGDASGKDYGGNWDMGDGTDNFNGSYLEFSCSLDSTPEQLAEALKSWYEEQRRAE